MKKIIIFISIIIICIIAISCIIMSKNKEKLKYQLEIVSEINYMVFSENNKFGVINKNGEVVVKSLYDEIQIPNPSKPLFICMYDYNEEKKQYSIKILNEKSEQILYQYVVVEAISINPATSSIPYEKSVLKYKDNEKYGIIDFNGNVILKAKYDEISGLDYREGLLLVKNKDKYGVVNINGAIVIKPKYDIIQSDGYYDDEFQYGKSGFIIGNQDNDSYKYGYINSEGKKILDIKYNQIDRIGRLDKNDDNTYLVAFENGKAGFYKNKKSILKHEYEDIWYDSNNNCLVLQKEFKQGISDFEGNTIIDIKYDNIFNSGKYINAQKDGNTEVFDYSTKKNINVKNVIGLNETLNNNYAIAVTKDEKYKVFDISKEDIKENEYDYLEYLYDDYFLAMNNSKYGIVDVNGNKIFDCKYDFLQKMGDTKIVQAYITYKNVTDVLVGDKVICSMKNADMFLKENYLVLLSDIDVKYIGFNGEILENNAIFNNELYAIKQKNQWGFVNKNNQIVVKPKYDFVTEFNEYGFAGIKKDGKWGSINLKGEVVIEPVYEIEINCPKFIGKYYEYGLGYGVTFFVGDIVKNQ